MNKIMKFISKNANLRIVLRQAMPPEPVTGRLAVPGLYIKFENGIVNVNNEEHVKMMLVHSGFDSDFISVEEEQKDPFKNTRTETEPDHLITEFEHGRAEKLKGSSHNVRLDPKLKDVAQKMAIEMAKEMAPQLAKDMLLEMAKQRKATKVQEENSRRASGPEESEPAEDTSLNVPEDEEIVVDEVEAVDIGKTEETENIEFKCSCGKTAKSNAGLVAHQRTCEKAKVIKEQ